MAMSAGQFPPACVADYIQAQRTITNTKWFDYKTNIEVRALTKDNRFNVILPKVAYAGLAIYSDLHSAILPTPSTPPTLGLRPEGWSRPREPPARDGATSSRKTSNSGDNTGRGFQHRHRPYPLEVNHCCSSRLHAIVARAM